MNNSSKEITIKLDPAFVPPPQPVQDFEYGGEYGGYDDSLGYEEVSDQVNTFLSELLEIKLLSRDGKEVSADFFGATSTTTSTSTTTPSTPSTPSKSAPSKSTPSTTPSSSSAPVLVPSPTPASIAQASPTNNTNKNNTTKTNTNKRERRSRAGLSGLLVTLQKEAQKDEPNSENNTENGTGS